MLDEIKRRVQESCMVKLKFKVKISILGNISLAFSYAKHMILFNRRNFVLSHTVIKIRTQVYLILKSVLNFY